MAEQNSGSITEKINRKRKIIDSAGSNDLSIIIQSEVNASNDHNPVAAKARDRGSKSRRDLNRSSLTKCSIPWPDFFQRLEKTHKALNLVFTFCCTRKYLATKFDTIKSAVEGHIGRELKVEDVAQVVAIRPSGMSFTYVDEAKLQIDVQVSEKRTSLLGGRASDWHRAEPLSGASLGVNECGADEKCRQEVLLFEFTDGDFKRQVYSKKIGQPTKATPKSRAKDLKMPVYSQKQMLGLIEKRNTKFASAVDAFLNACQTEGINPEKKLLEETLSYIPQPSYPCHTIDRQINDMNSVIPKDRKPISEIIAEIRECGFYKGQIVPGGHRVFDPQEAVYGYLNFKLSQCLVNALYNTKNITKLYSHQAEAINNLHDGYHVIVATSTSSGKSLIYQIPVLYELERDPNTRAMYIFPTKALAQDQRRSLKEMMRFMRGLEETIVETFDGATDMKDRNLIRDEGRIIFTNPDMLHMTILPQEEKWRGFLKSLKFVIMDEIHVYNGLFGSHVALIMRRLRRICAALGNRQIKFISCSATVANPLEHFKTLFGIDNVKVTNFDGSPSGRKEFLCWNTPFKDPGDPASGRGDIISEAAQLFCQLILRGVRSIAFCRTRRSCEALVGAVKNELATLERTECMARIMGYRGGYTPQDRRQIESQMFEGKLLGIVATTALELGIDIGSLDAVIIVGFPYTISNLRQQSGRAGRRNKDSLSVLIGDSFPTDQYYMKHPDEIFTKPNAELQIDLQNMLVLEGHIQCAAHEMPIRANGDTEYFPKNLKEIAESRLIPDNLGFYHCHDSFRPTPSKLVSIRDTEEDHFAIIDVSHGKNIVLEELEESRAFFTLYDGGIFLHQGNTYLVKEFNPEKKIARVELVRVDWTTQQCNFTDIDPYETEVIRRIPDSLSRAFYGKIKIQKTVFGFYKVDKKRRILDAIQVNNPPIISYSKGMWLDVPKQALKILVQKRINIVGAIHAAEHAVLSLMPTFIISMPDDVRTECKASHKEFTRKYISRKRPARLTFYDARGGAGGSGISVKAFEYIDLLLKKALKRVETCQCHEGCMECVTSELCKHENEAMSKAGAGVILKSFLNIHIDLDSVPTGSEEFIPAKVETMQLAQPLLPRGRVDILQAYRDTSGTKHIVVGSIDEEGVESEIKVEEGN